MNFTIAQLGAIWVVIRRVRPYFASFSSREYIQVQLELDTLLKNLSACEARAVFTSLSAAISIAKEAWRSVSMDFIVGL